MYFLNFVSTPTSPQGTHHSRVPIKKGIQRLSVNVNLTEFSLFFFFGDIRHSHLCFEWRSIEHPIHQAMTPRRWVMRQEMMVAQSKISSKFMIRMIIANFHYLSPLGVMTSFRSTRCKILVRFIKSTDPFNLPVMNPVWSIHRQAKIMKTALEC